MSAIKSGDGWRFSRRNLLAKLGVSGAFLPLLNASQGWAAPVSPKRLIVIGWPEGIINKPVSFWPTGTETAFKIESDYVHAPLQPLIPHQKDILLLGGMELTCLKVFKGAGHAAAPALLTGHCVKSTAGASNEAGVTAAGPSVDQFIAEEIAKQNPTPIKSLVLQSTYAFASERYISYRGAPEGGKKNVPTPETSVFKLFDTLFKGQMLTGSTMVSVRNHRQSVLDYARGRLTALGKNLGAEDRIQIDRHMSSIRETENEVNALAVASAACKAPGAPDSTKKYAPNDGTGNQGGAFQSPLIPEIHKLQIDMTVTAMACGLTRVASLAWGDAWNVAYVFHWLNDKAVGMGLGPIFDGLDKDDAGYGTKFRNHHTLAHHAASSPESIIRKNMVDQWFFSQFAYLLEQLKLRSEGGKTMLDNSIAWMANMFENGAAHSITDLPWVLGGSCGGYFKTGRFVRQVLPGKNNTPHNGLLAHLCNAMDVPVEKFGNPEFHADMPMIRG